MLCFKVRQFKWNTVWLCCCELQTGWGLNVGFYCLPPPARAIMLFGEMQQIGTWLHGGEDLTWLCCLCPGMGQCSDMRCVSLTCLMQEPGEGWHLFVLQVLIRILCPGSGIQSFTQIVTEKNAEFSTLLRLGLGLESHKIDIFTQCRVW